MSDDGSRLWSRPQAPDLTAPPPPPPPEGPAAAPAPSAGDGLPPSKHAADSPPPLRHWWAGLAAFGLSVVVAAIGLGVIAALTGDRGDLDTGTTIASTYVQDAAFFVTAYLFARLSYRAAPRLALGLRRPVRPGQAAGVALLVWVAFLVASGVYGTLAGIDDASEETVDSLGLRDSTLNLVLAGVLVAVLAPIVEETLFRGLLFGALWRRFGWVVGAVASGVTFGLIHAGGAVAEALPVLAVLGFALAWVYRRTGSLVPGIGIHSLNNSIALASTVSWDFSWKAVLVVGTTAGTVLLAWALSVPVRRAT